MVAAQAPASTVCALKPREFAQRWGVSAEWVRDHQHALGAIALGDGPKPRLAVPLDSGDAYMASRGLAPEPFDPSSRLPLPRQARKQTASVTAAGNPMLKSLPLLPLPPRR